MTTYSPEDFEVEVTLIGTGGGYGESVVMKIGLDSWIIVDSCINPFTKQPLPIEYLNSIGCNLQKVVLVICTHWHNDHIKGLAQVLSLCPRAEFCFSAVHDLKKFLLLCELDAAKALKGGSVSSTNEFAKCLEIINGRGTTFTKAQCNLVLSSVDQGNSKFVLYALAPSPKTISDFDSEISTLISRFGKRNTAVVKKSPNDKSVALLLAFGTHRVLLGGDLEIGKSDQEGWRHILKHCKVVDKHKAQLFKLPHHGSENGYLKEIFDILVNDNGVLKLTPYRSSNLPTPDMMNIYSTHSSTIYLTSTTTVSKKAKKRDPSIEKIINRSVRSLTEAKFSHGIVRSRINYKDPSASWKTELLYGAVKHAVVQGR